MEVIKYFKIFILTHFCPLNLMIYVDTKLLKIFHF